MELQEIKIDQTQSENSETIPEQSPSIDKKESFFLTTIRLILWRIIATTTSILVSFILTKDISKALSIGIIDNLIKMIIQFFYERIWIYFLKGETESKMLTCIRVVIWRIIGIALTILIAFIITGSIGDAISIGIIDHVIKIILHFLFERTWIYYFSQKN